MLPSINLEKIKSITEDAAAGKAKFWARRDSMAFIYGDYVNYGCGSIATRSGKFWISDSGVPLTGTGWITGGIPLSPNTLPVNKCKIIIIDNEIVPEEAYGHIEELIAIRGSNLIECTAHFTGNAKQHVMLDGRGEVWEIVDNSFIKEVVRADDKAVVPPDFQCPSCGGRLTYFRFAEYCPVCNMVARGDGKWAPLL